MRFQGLIRSLVAVALLGACSGGKTTISPSGSAGDAGAGGAVVGGGAGGAGGGAAGTAGTGGSGRQPFVARPRCSTDAECTVGVATACRRFGKDGPGRCLGPVQSLTECVGGAGSNLPKQDCCSSADCGAGRCVQLVTSPIACSLTAGFDIRNRCVVDECASDAECAAGEVCAPEGFLAARACMPALCASDADCTAEPGGVCAVLALGCCRSVAYASRGTQLACVYPSDGCELDTDCADTESCVITAGRAHCSASCP